MLGIATLIFIIILSFKLFIAMNRHYEVMVNNGVAPLKVRAVQISPLLYIPALAALVLPISWLGGLLLIPFGFLLLVPGITLGKKYSKMFECSGTDVGVAAGRTMSNIMWLGIGVIVFILGNSVISFLI